VIANSATAAETTFMLPTSMRIPPTISYNLSVGTYRLIGGSTNVVLTALTVDSAQAGNQQVVISFTTASGLTDGKVYILRVENDNTGYIALSSEL
jgi:hypothetical protein